jgi:hypothetical protein
MRFCIALTDVANELRDSGAPNEEECFIDATFVMAKGGGLEIGATKRGKGMKIMAIVDRHGLPLSVSTHAANHHPQFSGQVSPHRLSRPNIRSWRRSVRGKKNESTIARSRPPNKESCRAIVRNSSSAAWKNRAPASREWIQTRAADSAPSPRFAGRGSARRHLASSKTKTI